MRNKQKGYMLFELIVTVLVVSGVIGYVLNIIRLAHDVGMSQPNLLMVILRIIGVFTGGLGAILGYISG